MVRLKMEKGSLVLDPTGLLPVKPEWIDPGDQRSMVIMTSVLSRRAVRRAPFSVPVTGLT